jgi:nucleoside 2-deoxyribosyltransferase
MDMKLFLAAPLFNEAERAFNATLAATLRAQGFDVWLAQEAPFLQHDDPHEKRRLYDGDILALKASDVVVAVLDGVEVDAGVAFEMGYAAALGKPLIALKTDYRAFSRMEEVNLMLEAPVIQLCTRIDEVLTALRTIQ